MVSRDPNYADLYSQMSPIARDPALSRSVDLLWRLSAVTLGLTTTLDPLTQREDLQTKTVEARQYAENAVKACGTNFHANLWAAKAMAQMALCETDHKTRIASLDGCVKHLNKCLGQEPKNWRVLLLECQV